MSKITEQSSVVARKAARKMLKIKVIAVMIKLSQLIRIRFKNLTILPLGTAVSTGPPIRHPTNRD